MKKPPLPINEKERQAVLDSYAIINSLPEESFDDLTLIASQICDTPIALISLIDNDRQWFKSRFGLEATETHRDISFCGHAINEPNEIFEIQNTHEDDRFRDNPLVTDDPNIRFYAGVPLVNEENYALGTLCVIDQEPKKLSQHQRKALAALAREVMRRIELRRKNNELEKELESNVQDIKQLKENNYRYLSLFDFAPIGIAISNLKGKVVQTNRIFEEMLGYSKEELLKMSISSLTFPEDLEETKTQLKKMIQGEISSFTLEKRYSSKSGEIVMARVSSAFVKNEKNEPTYLIGTIEDITEEKKFAQQYALNMERLDLAVEGANDGILDWKDVRQDEQWWSPRFYDLLGYQEGEIKPLFSVFAEKLLYSKDYATIKGSIENCIIKGEPFDSEFRLQTKEGSYKWFRGKGKRSILKGGKVVRMTGSVSDIDERKRLELKLNETQEFLKKVMDIAPSIIYVFNQQTLSNEYANRELGGILGYSTEEIQTLGAELMPRLCHPEDLEKVFEHFSVVSALKDGEVANIEYRMKHKDGRYHWLLSEDTVFERERNGKVVKQLGVATDITDVKRAQERLQVQNQDLKQFTYVVTHDLRSPLVTLEGHFKYIKEQFDQPSEEVKESIEFIEEELQNFTSTLQGLNEAIKLREFKVDLVSIDLRDLINQALPNYQKKIEELNGRLEVKFADGTKVLGTDFYIRSILKNLLSNAIKYRSPERSLIVEVSTKLENKRLKLSIKDNGLGLDLTMHKDRMFKMFNRFHHHSEGTGMGLYMVKSMAEKMKGGVDAESSENVGSTFSVYFKLENE